MDFILLESTILICIIVVYIVFSSSKSSKAIMQVYLLHFSTFSLDVTNSQSRQRSIKWKESTLSSWNTQKLKPFWLHDRFQAVKESHKPKHSKGKTMWHGEKINEVLLNLEWTWNMKRNANATLNYCRKESVCQVFKMIL